MTSTCETCLILDVVATSMSKDIDHVTVRLFVSWHALSDRRRRPAHSLKPFFMIRPADWGVVPWNRTLPLPLCAGSLP